MMSIQRVGVDAAGGAPVDFVGGILIGRAIPSEGDIVCSGERGRGAEEEESKGGEEGLGRWSVHYDKMSSYGNYKQRACRSSSIVNQSPLFRVA